MRGTGRVIFRRSRVAALAALLISALAPVASNAAAPSGTRKPPTARTAAAYGVGVHEAVVAGYINPRGSTVTFRFRWGRTESYGHIAPAGGVEEGLYPGHQEEEVEAVLFDLAPDTVYHYRIVAYSHGVKVFGRDKAFRTKPVGEELASHLYPSG